MIPQRTDEAGVARSLQTTYQVRIRLEAEQEVLPGATGQVLIVAPAADSGDAIEAVV